METDKKQRQPRIWLINIVLFLAITAGAAGYYYFFSKDDLNLAAESVEDSTGSIEEDTAFTLPDDNSRYQLGNGELKVTYDNGANWETVPVSMEELFAGDYSGSRQELIEKSYEITQSRTAFVIGEEIMSSDNSYSTVHLQLLVSTDKGESWGKAEITQLPGIRARFFGFTSAQNGYAIVTNDRTMGFEANAVYKTNDAGNTWRRAGSVEETNQHVTGGTFIDKDLGFISFGAVSVNFEPERPSLYRTADGGVSWEEVEVPVPEEYKGIFTIAEMPVFEGSEGILHVNQGPMGDYQGGKVLAEFTSADNGASWTFAKVVDPK